jgi:hypothetical protein
MAASEESEALREIAQGNAQFRFGFKGRWAGSVENGLA